MKKAIIFSAFLFIATAGFSQAKKDTTIAPPKPRQFVLVLNEDELNGLYNFITNGDIYSEKGKRQYLASLDQHVREVPVPAAADTSKPKK